VRNLLLVTLDTTRADVLSGDDASRALAPRIGALGEHGVRFTRAYTVAPLTLPAHASLLTGLVPQRHGVRDNGHAALPESAHTLAEVLRERGFETAAFVSALVLDRGFGLAQGFEHWDQPPLVARELGVEHLERPARATVDAASAWLARRETDQPFFLWVHLYDAHFPYAPAPEHLERARHDPYRGEIAALDEAVGRLVDALAEHGFASETLITLTADHGESLGEHGEPMHGALCYEAAVRVPLLFHFPAEPPPPGPTRLASLVDLFPTVLGRLGAPIPPELDGVDLFAAPAPPERGVYFESLTGHLNFGWSALVGWVDWRGKYLHSSDPEFYAILRDPLERSDLADSRVRECEKAREHLAEVLARPALAGEPRGASAELDAALSALGYARGASSAPELPSPLAPSTLPSPRSRAQELKPLQRAHELFEARRYAECRPLVAEILRGNPRHLLAADYLALCAMHAREFERAEEILRQRLAIAEAADARLNLGLCRLELGDPEAALREFEAADELSPGHPEVRAALSRARARLGR
jgi:arylsulfatase A-like enzyme/Tfp pilus assembly protein PilF